MITAAHLNVLSLCWTHCDGACCYLLSVAAASDRLTIGQCVLADTADRMRQLFRLFDTP